MRHIFYLSIVFFCFPFYVFGQLIHYAANVDNSQWELKTQPKIQCQLIHQIPSYGEAIFTSNASKDMTIDFLLDMWNRPSAHTKVDLFSRAAYWSSGRMDKKLYSGRLYRNFDGELPKELAWTVLNELDNGSEPVFQYTDWNNDNYQVTVALSAVNFSETYYKFRLCISQLLPYSYEDIAFTALNYQFGGTELTSDSIKQLARVKEYLIHDPLVDDIIINAYTDSYGDLTINQKVSETRAKDIKQTFIEAGIDEAQIQTFGYGERRHISDNEFESHRSKNRRVIIRIKDK